MITAIEELKKRITDINALIFLNVQDSTPSIDDLEIWELHIKLDCYKEILTILEGPSNVKT